MPPLMVSGQRALWVHSRSLAWRAARKWRQSNDCDSLDLDEKPRQPQCRYAHQSGGERRRTAEDVRSRGCQRLDRRLQVSPNLLGLVQVGAANHFACGVDGRLAGDVHNFRPCRDRYVRNFRNHEQFGRVDPVGNHWMTSVCALLHPSDGPPSASTKLAGADAKSSVLTSNGRQMTFVNTRVCGCAAACRPRNWRARRESAFPRCSGSGHPSDHRGCTSRGCRKNRCWGSCSGDGLCHAVQIPVSSPSAVGRIEQRMNYEKAWCPRCRRPAI
jgi:hypothetical protein